VAICSFDLSPLVNARLLGAFDVLIIDESHSLKSLDTKRTQSILGKQGLCRKSNRTWMLTGTPAPNHAGELWTTLFTFGATNLKYWDFVNKFCLTRDSGFGLQIVGTKTDAPTLTELRTILKKVSKRREEKDVGIQLPKLNFSSVLVPPGPVDLSVTEFWKYVIPTDRMEDFKKQIEEELGVFNSIVKSAGGYKASEQLIEVLKAQSASISTLRRYTALQKLEPALEMIKEELTNNAFHKCVIFAVHKCMIQGAQRYLHEFNPVTLYGGTAPASREMNIKRFQNPESKYRVFIGNIAAAGTSITLDQAHHIFFLEEDWVPGNNQQAAMRCGGPRQKKPIFVRSFALKDSYDQRIQQLLIKKSFEINKIFETELPEKPTLDNFL